MRIALGIEYDGSGFCGWQTQTAGCAVQDRLEAACSAIAGVPVDMVCAGRTDAGVHALGQVVHFDCGVERPASAWVRGVNALLPPAIAVIWAKPVGEGFHARFSALSRSYRYVLLNDPVRPAADHGRVGWYHAALDLGRMREAAACLVGEHDFSSFRSAECQAKSPVRTLHEVEISASGRYLVFDFRANAFLHHMVRNLVGSLVHVGKGKHPPQWIGEVLRGRYRAQAAPTFEASGLYLMQVDYGPGPDLPRPRQAGARFAALGVLA
ncbi:MAG: tRNA pseudouridine(38-40) synthase TruA [Betaproteobacteria bacterium]|jgi:tRNA pseudouridine38-40 synthase